MKELQTYTPELKQENSCSGCKALSYDANNDELACFLKFEIQPNEKDSEKYIPEESCTKCTTWEAFFNGMIEKYNNLHVGMYSSHGARHLNKLAEKYGVDPKSLPTDKVKALKEIRDVHAKATI